MKFKSLVTEKTSKIKLGKSFFTKKKIILICAIVLCIALICWFALGKGKKNDETQKAYVEARAYIGDITETIEQSGVVEPYERYEITSLVRGEIISSPFEEGDFVNEGDTLYQIDNEDAQLSMEKAQMSLDEANEDVSKLNIYAPASGRLSDFSLDVGNNVGNGIIGKIINTDKLSVDIPFSVDDFNKISVGDNVTITSALYMTSLPGRVTHKYYANAETGSESSVLRNVEIELENPGALAENTTFAATVHTSMGDVNSSGSGTIGKGNVSEMRAEVNGVVSYVGFKNGDYVSKGQLIAKLTNNSVVNAQKSSRLNLKSTQKTLDNYNITAPISGTVITKNSKAGDKIDSSNSQTPMMVIADMSKMKFTISVDELDISNIKLGQTAIVDADALPDETFEAKVTTIASEGVSSGDGVTTYDIELTIYEPGNLKSGMNVNANILINEAKNVVVIPEDALMSVRGTSATVLVKTDGKEQQTDTKSNTKRDAAPPQGMMKRPEGAEKDKIPQSTENGKMPQKAENSEIPQEHKGETNGDEKMPAGGARSNIPEGCEIRRVEVGISDGTNIEIISGISEGETVVYIPSSSGSQTGFMGMMGRMHGGMMGGGMPRTNMSGGTNRAGNRNSGGMQMRR